MAITNVNQLVSGLQSPFFYYKYTKGSEAAYVYNTAWYINGIPGAAIVTTSGRNGEALTSYSGQIPFRNPPSGEYAYLSNFNAFSLYAPNAILCDRLWHNGGITITDSAEQIITGGSVQWPARCPSITGGDIPDSNGWKIKIGLEVSTQTTNPSTVILISYTNHLGVSGRIGRIQSWLSSILAGSFYTFELPSGDYVRSVESITLGANLGAGIVHLVAYRELASINSVLGYNQDINSPFEHKFPRLYDNTVPFIISFPNATPSDRQSAMIGYAHG